jgi:hypothetical protein
MKLLWLLIILISPLLADFKKMPEPSYIQKDQQPTAINVNFKMGNSQEVPTENNATSTTKKIHVEHKMEPLPQETIFTKIKNSFIGGAAGALGSAAAYKIIENSETILEFFKKIVFRG